jgi:hypothetical protein
MGTDPFIRDALTRAIPLRTELDPAWEEVLARTTPPRRPRRHLRTSRWALAGALVAAACLSVGGLAIADAVSSSLHGATIWVAGTTIGGPGGILNCSLIGKPADEAASTLAGSGIAVEWRLTQWGGAVTPATIGEPTPTTPQEKAQESARAGALEVASAEAVTGGSSDVVSAAPAGSVVWDVIPDGQAKAFVFVEAANDPNAPKVGCPG